MNKQKNYRERILNESSYWVQGINNAMYDAIVQFMETHEMKQKDLAEHLEISTGRVSQILNDGEMNFSIEKLISTALKIDKLPILKFEDKASYIAKEKELADRKSWVFNFNIIDMTDTIEDTFTAKEPKVIQLKPSIVYNYSKVI